MPSLVLIGPAVRPATGNIQTDRHNAFYYRYVDTTLKIRIMWNQSSHHKIPQMKQLKSDYGTFVLMLFIDNYADV